jgi:hypothetical protein
MVKPQKLRATIKLSKIRAFMIFSFLNTLKAVPGRPISCRMLADSLSDIHHCFPNDEKHGIRLAAHRVRINRCNCYFSEMEYAVTGITKDPFGA